MEIEEQQVTTKDPKEVEAGKRLAEYNRRKRKELKSESKKVKPKLTLSQYYGVGAVVAIGALGVLGYCVYQFKKGEPKED